MMKETNPYYRMPCGVIIYDSSTETFSANPAALTLLAAQDDEKNIIGLLNGTWKLTDSDGRNWSAKKHPVKQVLRDAKPFHRVMGVFQPHQKRWIWLDLHVSVYQVPEGLHQTTVMLTFSELSAPLQDSKTPQDAHFWLSSLVNNLPGIAFRCKNDAEWTMEYLSPMFYTITGYAPEEMLQNKEIAFNDIIVAEDREFVSREVVNAVRTHEQYDIEYRIRRKDGRIRWVSERGQAIYYKNEKDLRIEGFIMDITRRKEAETRLKQSESRFRNLFHNHVAVSLVVDPVTGNIIDANKAAEEFYGWTNNELRSMNMVQINGLTPEEMRDKMKLAVNHQQETFDLKHRLKNGKVRDVVAYSAVINEGDQKLVYAIIFDVTEKKRNEQYLQWLSEAIDRNPVATLITDADTRVEFVNQAFCELTGYTRERLIGMNASNFRQEYVPAGQYDAMKSGLDKNATWSGELTLNLRNQPPKKLSSLVSCIRSRTTGEVINYVALQQDISELLTAKKDAQTHRQQVTAIYESIPDLIFRFNRDLILLQYKGERRELHVQDQQMIGRSLGEMLPGSLVKTIREAMEKALTERTLQSFHYDLEIPERGLRHFDARMAPSGEDEVTVIVRDVTPQIQYQNELLLAKEHAEESDRLKSAFLATMNHELRTPLNHIIGFSGLLKDGHELNNVREFSELIYSSGVDLLNMIEDIFALAILEQGKVVIRKDRIVLGSLSDELELLMNQINEKKGKKQLAFKVEMKKALTGLPLETDRSKIMQVMNNLISNAVKFTERGGVTVDIGMQDTRCLMLSVTDTGIGISPDSLGVIFDFFRQADDSHTRRYGGVGIGLAISRLIIRAMGGEITVESTVGSGTTFTMRIPVTPVV